MMREVSNFYKGLFEFKELKEISKTFYIIIILDIVHIQ